MNNIEQFIEKVMDRVGEITVIEGFYDGVKKRKIIKEESEDLKSLMDEIIDKAIRNQFNEFLGILLDRNEIWLRALKEDNMSSMNKPKVLIKQKELYWVISQLTMFRNLPQPPKEAIKEEK